MLVEIATNDVMEDRENVAGVVHLDTVAGKVGCLEMDVMDRLGVMINMFVLLSQQVSSIFLAARQSPQQL